MAAHRYWRLKLPPDDIFNGTSLSQIELRESIGGADVAAGATKASNHPLANIANYFDGDNGTSYYAVASANEAFSLYIDFDFAGTPRDIKEVMYRTASNAALAPLSVMLWYRDSASDPWSFTDLNASAYDGATTNTNYTFSGFSELPTSTNLFNPGIKLLGTGLASPNWKTMQQPIFMRDLYYGGTGRIVGTVKEDASPTDLPLRRRVRLFRDRDGHFIRETWSDAATGIYSFENIDMNERYTAVAYDYEHDYRAVIADNLQAEAMP